MVEQLYVAQYVPCSNQGIHPKKNEYFWATAADDEVRADNKINTTINLIASKGIEPLYVMMKTLCLNHLTIRPFYLFMSPVQVSHLLMLVTKQLHYFYANQAKYCMICFVLFLVFVLFLGFVIMNDINNSQF
jgi:hypothetical protein